jgi:oxygen-dependent protoporphyrinogen oxidase
VTAPASSGVVVVGAGITGLAAAAAVRGERPDVDVVVLEASDHVGGKLRRAEVGGALVDVGAETFLFRRSEAVDLATELGLADRLVHPATHSARIWSRGQLRPLPRSVMGVPADPDDVAASGLLSPAGVEQVRREPDVPTTPLPLDDPDWDVGVLDLVGRRLLTEAGERMVEPLLGGVYAGHARELSARAATPQLVDLLARHGSLVRGAAAQLGEGSDERPVFAGLDGGVGGLVEALTARLDVRTGTTVRALERTETGWRLTVGPTRDEHQVEASAVIVATPAPAAARLLAGACPTASADLAAVEVASMAVITLALPADRVPELEGSGFLVPPVEGRTVKAATYSFQKWDWVRREGGRSGLVHVRVSVGRHREAAVLQRDDDELVSLAVAELRDLVGLDAAPVDAHVQRWGGGLPQYAVGHLGRVRRIRAAVTQVPGLAVCGATYDGVGIPACIASARLAAAQVLRGQ